MLPGSIALLTGLTSLEARIEFTDGCLIAAASRWRGRPMPPGPENQGAMDTEKHEPRFYKGKPMHWLKSEPVFYRFAGPDRILCSAT